MRIKKNGKVINLTESDIKRLSKRILSEQTPITADQKEVIKFLDSNLEGLGYESTEDDGEIVKMKAYGPNNEAWVVVTINKDGGGSIIVSNSIKNYIKKESKKWYERKVPGMKPSKAPGYWKTDCEGIEGFGNISIEKRWRDMLDDKFTTYQYGQISQEMMDKHGLAPNTTKEIISMWGRMLETLDLFDCDVIQRMEWDKVITPRTTKPKFSLFSVEDIKDWEDTNKWHKEKSTGPYDDYKTLADTQ